MFYYIIIFVLCFGSYAPPKNATTMVQGQESADGVQLNQVKKQLPDTESAVSDVEGLSEVEGTIRETKGLNKVEKPMISRLAYCVVFPRDVISVMGKSKKSGKKVTFVDKPIVVEVCEQRGNLEALYSKIRGYGSAYCAGPSFYNPFNSFEKQDCEESTNNVLSFITNCSGYEEKELNNTFPKSNEVNTIDNIIAAIKENQIGFLQYRGIEGLNALSNYLEYLSKTVIEKYKILCDNFLNNTCKWIRFQYSDLPSSNMEIYISEEYLKYWKELSALYSLDCFRRIASQINYYAEKIRICFPELINEVAALCVTLNEIMQKKSSVLCMFGIGESNRQHNVKKDYVIVFYFERALFELESEINRLLKKLQKCLEENKNNQSLFDGLLYSNICEERSEVWSQNKDYKIVFQHIEPQLGYSNKIIVGYCNGLVYVDVVGGIRCYFYMNDGKFCGLMGEDERVYLLLNLYLLFNSRFNVLVKTFSDNYYRYARLGIFDGKNKIIELEKAPTEGPEAVLVNWIIAELKSLVTIPSCGALIKRTSYY